MNGNINHKKGRWFTWMKTYRTKPYATTTGQPQVEKCLVPYNNGTNQIGFRWLWRLFPQELHLERSWIPDLRSSSPNCFFVSKGCCAPRWSTIDWIDSSVCRMTPCNDWEQWGINPGSDRPAFLETTLEHIMQGNVPEAPLHSIKAFRAASSETQSFSSPTNMMPPAIGSLMPLSNLQTIPWVLLRRLLSWLFSAVRFEERTACAIPILMPGKQRPFLSPPSIFPTLCAGWWLSKASPLHLVAIKNKLPRFRQTRWVRVVLGGHELSEVRANTAQVIEPCYWVDVPGHDQHVGGISHLVASPATWRHHASRVSKQNISCCRRRSTKQLDMTWHHKKLYLKTPRGSILMSAPAWVKLRDRSTGPMGVSTLMAWSLARLIPCRDKPDSSKIRKVLHTLQNFAESTLRNIALSRKICQRLWWHDEKQLGQNIHEQQWQGFFRLSMPVKEEDVFS